MDRYREIIENIYLVFAQYDGGIPFDCDYCHPKDWQQYFVETPLREISEDHGYSLATEVVDHWFGSLVYRHYLPRVLELLGPPFLVDDLCPELIFEKLLAMGYCQWPSAEQQAVKEYFEYIA